MKKFIKFILFAFVFITPFGCKNDNIDLSNDAYLTNKTAEYSGDLAHEWMQLGYEMIKENHLYGPHAARTYGYLGLTVWESVYRGIPNAKSMSQQINDFPRAANIDETKVYDWGVVLCTAMKIVFPELIDQVTSSQRSTVIVLAEQQENEMLNKGLNRSVFENSRDYGTLVAANILDRIRKDGRDIIRNIVPQLPLRDAEHPWYWDKNTYNQVPVEPMWGTLRTFMIDNSQTCEAESPLSYSTDPNSAFYKEAKEVYDIVKSDANKKLAYHFDNGPGRTCSPACHWVSITEQFLKKDARDLAISAKAYCLVGFAAADAFSNAWYMKYKYNLLRPSTYIKEVFAANWEPLLSTPPYPEFISAAAIIGGAAPVVLVRIFDDRTFVDNTHLGSPLYTPDGGPFLLPERQFESITQCGKEQAESRIVGGVHFRRACELGLKSGRCIGNNILAQLDFGF
jgi:hypothetical protein